MGRRRDRRSPRADRGSRILGRPAVRASGARQATARFARACSPSYSRPKPCPADLRGRTASALGQVRHTATRSSPVSSRSRACTLAAWAGRPVYMPRRRATARALASATASASPAGDSAAGHCYAASRPFACSYAQARRSSQVASLRSRLTGDHHPGTGQVADRERKPRLGGPDRGHADRVPRARQHPRRAAAVMRDVDNPLAADPVPLPAAASSGSTFPFTSRPRPRRPGLPGSGGRVPPSGSGHARWA